MIADGARQIHNAFDKAFEGSSHVFCSFHLREHIGKWFAGCKEKDVLIELTKDGLCATNLESLEVTVEHIHELSSDVPDKTVEKVSRYLAEQHHANRTSSQPPPQQVGGVSREMVP